MVQRFFKNEVGYEDWFSKNPEGLVLNVYEENVTTDKLHLANCFHLRAEGEEGRRTNSYEKVCSDSAEELMVEATRIGIKRNKVWAWCPHCKKKFDEKAARFLKL
ncbi:hypothetical protein [Cohnella yongneupensis]|uniref:Uncharacterized protein n=1 Tax=Cohnella yongneupensis TaxID=425006 RepID=A0ABW0QZW5_9BACL